MLNRINLAAIVAPALLALMLTVAVGADDQTGPTLHRIDPSSQPVPNEPEPADDISLPMGAPCVWEVDYCQPAAHIFTITGVHGAYALGQRFTPPTPGTLTALRVYVDEDAVEGTPDLEVYVCRSYSAGIPTYKDYYARVEIPFEDIVYFPDFVELTQSDFGVDSFAVWLECYVVVGVVGQSGVLGFVSDDGTCGDRRGVIFRYYDFQPVLETDGIDVNFFIEAEFCDCCNTRGDFDHSGRVDMEDMVDWVHWAFHIGYDAPYCLSELDVNADGRVDVVDMVDWIKWSFAFGPPPIPCPFGA